MRKYLRFLKTVLLHKWYVFIAGRRLRVPIWRLVEHDLSKLSFAEFAAYARRFYGDTKDVDLAKVHYLHRTDPTGFDRAWLHHLRWTEHHWESWIIPEGNQEMDITEQPHSPLFTSTRLITVPTVTILPMPMTCVREMVADWFAAGKAYNGAWPNPTDYTWYKANEPKMQLHPDTKMRIGLVLAEAAQWKW